MSVKKARHKEMSNHQGKEETLEKFTATSAQPGGKLFFGFAKKKVLKLKLG